MTQTAITDINTLISERHKIIVIQAAGGVGKTTLAKQYLYKNFDLVLPLEMAKDTENITAVESEIETWLKQYFQEEPGRDFKTTLNRLKQQLQTRKVGVLIDNLEPALDKQGRFIEKHNLYVELLRVLGDENVQSLTLITSRERLCDDRIDRSIYHYPLAVLDVTAWSEFFTTRKIKIDTPSLEAMHKIYGGNAKAMDILLGVIRTDYDGDMSAYWQENCTLVETELKNLVESQFNRLQTLDIDAYKLLCRLGCFRYQDVPRVSIDALLALLWDISEDKRRDVIKSLRNEFEKGEYWLHPVVREQAIERLKASGEWEEVNRKAAEFWTESVNTVRTIEDAKKAFEAYYHYLDINDFEKCVAVIIQRRDEPWKKDVHKRLTLPPSLAGSFSRFGLLERMIFSIRKIVCYIPQGYLLIQLNNTLGDLYWRIGYIHEAIKSYQDSQAIAIKFNVENLDYLEIDSLYNIGRCKVELGEIAEAIELLEKAHASSEYSKWHVRSVSILFNLAFLYSCLGFQEKATYLAEKIYHEIPSTPLGIKSTGYRSLFLGLTYINLSNFNQALEILISALSYAEKINFIQMKGKTLVGLAQIHREQDNFEKSLDQHSESIEILDKIGAKCDLAEAYYQLGLTYQKMGETEKSNTNFNEAIQLYQEMEAPKQVEKAKKAKRGNIDSQNVRV
ncbi:tetratricopeptide repeat protein [Anabaena sphaerica FACHB-251]|uniref:Tetratricopeptide repeat protein n=1 Tax=Anabaena sphaerica FACHB-251 TaxID=2692883 RepID=A0A926WIJ5_9NOST|nr:tetratricopeptide repeat protein [Anabaena sphaerica FACHB-251]